MCETCGCGAAGIASHGAHSHPHDHDQVDTRRIELGHAVLAHNDAHAAENRAWLRARGVRMVDLVSSPGSGKTTLLEATLDRLTSKLRVAVVTGDVQTDRDAQRLKGRGAAVEAIETGGACHLDATDVGRVLPRLVEAGGGEGLDLVIVENVGNLVCPAAFDLGQDVRIALLSVTEGEDKPLKYPALFHRAPVVVLTKIDLLPHLRFDRARCVENIRMVRPDARILNVSAFTGEGLDAWVALLEALR